MTSSKDVIMKFIKKEKGYLSNGELICAFGNLFLNSICVAYYEDNRKCVRINASITDKHIDELLWLLNQNKIEHIEWDFQKLY